MTDNDIIKAFNIDEAIKHCYEVAEQMCNECGKEHLQLAEWLEELKTSRETINRQKAEYQKLQSVLDEILVNERCNYENKIAELVTQKDWYKRQYDEICDNASLMGYESIVERARAEAKLKGEQ